MVDPCSPQLLRLLLGCGSEGRGSRAEPGKRLGQNPSPLETEGGGGPGLIFKSFRAGGRLMSVPKVKTAEERQGGREMLVASVGALVGLLLGRPGEDAREAAG